MKYEICKEQDYLSNLQPGIFTNICAMEDDTVRVSDSGKPTLDQSPSRVSDAAYQGSVY